eukprot:CAMPEP_0116035148 /NCGR_PEP_ID=MMETSP0321-20121206/20127_1 /TAXON_ID=163516 /ORGANISM="Leptocylindrus danicus var. danicus, Strain B650" /LENGTH=208 /DNA_ID=CAMNT_0003511789 /DNA_START=66 /DNA_END=688 /DNA_ORIENTATION=+
MSSVSFDATTFTHTLSKMNDAETNTAKRSRTFRRFRRRNSCTAKMLTSASIVRRTTLEEENHNEHAAAVSLSDSEFESRCSISNRRRNSEQSTSSDEEFPLQQLSGKRLYGSDGDECSLEVEYGTAHPYNDGELEENRNKRSRRGANGDFTTPYQWYSYSSADAYRKEHNSGEQDNSSPNSSSNLLSRRISPDSSPKSTTIRKTAAIA